MTKKQALELLDNIPVAAVSTKQKIVIEQIINSCTDETKLSSWFPFLVQKVKLGFTFDESPDVDETQIHLLKEVWEKRINVTDKNTSNNENCLIIGENLYALKNLLIAYENKIDIIYIDPPYNTERAKSDMESTNSVNSKFIYNDRFKRTGWLSMIKERLTIARKLLKDDGVIFISIDDNEQAYLKVLMDEIFGEENCVGEFIRKTKSTTNDQKQGFNYQHEFCLIFAKNHENFKFIGEEKTFSNYKNPDNDKNGSWVSDNPTTGGKGYYYEIKHPSGEIIKPPLNREWVFSKSKFFQMLNNGKIKWTDISKGRGFIYKRYKAEIRRNHYQVDSLLFTQNEFMNQNATKELMGIFSDKAKDEIFNYPKSTNFLMKIIKYSSNKNALVLDFFAGSGTTAHAVMDLNREDGGNRKFILCTNNENKIADNICYERLFRIITGKSSDGSEFSWIEKNKPYSDTKLRVFSLNTENCTILDDVDKLAKEYIDEYKKLNSFNIKNLINKFGDLF